MQTAWRMSAPSSQHDWYAQSNNDVRNLLEKKKNKCRASTPQLWFGKTCLLLDDGHGDPKREKNPLTSTTGRRFVSSQLETPCAHSTASKRLQRTFTFCCLYIRLVEFVKFWNSKFGFFEFLNFSICEIWNKKFGFLDFLNFWIFEFLKLWICEILKNLNFFKLLNFRATYFFFQTIRVKTHFLQVVCVVGVTVQHHFPLD